MSEIEIYNKTLIDFWDGVFKDVYVSKLNKDDFKVKNTLDEYLRILGETTDKLLDLGCGSGYCLLCAKQLGQKISYGLGIDPSSNAINKLNEIIKVSDISGLEFKQGTHHDLKEIEDHYFDGIVSSNVLDVVPEKTSNEMIDEINRLLKPGGLFVLKLNFYLNKELIEKIGMVKVLENTYTINGVVRGLNFTSREWIDKFPKFELIQQGEYQRLKKGPKDRVFMFRKRSFVK